MHLEFLKVGCDILSTNTFNATSLAQSEYNLSSFVKEINFRAVKIAQDAISTYQESSVEKKKIYIAGSVGPTSKSASISPKVGDPGFRDISFDQLVSAYSEQVSALISAGCDLLLLETVFDT